MVFEIALKGGDNGNVAWENFAFVLLKTTFNKHCLIKISTTCAYLNPEVKKNDTTAMTTATNEDCIGWWWRRNDTW